MRIVSLLLFCVCVAILCGSAATQTWIDVCPDYDPNDSTTVICYLSSFSPPPLNDLNTLINGAPCQSAKDCTIIVSPWAFQSEQNNVNQSSTRAFIGTNNDPLIPTYCCDPSQLSPPVHIHNMTIDLWDNCINATYNIFANSPFSWLISFYPCSKTENYYMVSGLTLNTQQQLTIKAADGDQVNFAVTADSFYVTSNATCNLFVITQGTITLQNVHLWSDPACSSIKGPVKKHTMLSVAPILYQPLATSNLGSLTLNTVNMYNAPFIALIIMPDASKNRPNITFTSNTPAPPPAPPTLTAPDFPSLTWNGIPNFWDIILIDPNPTEAPIPIVNGNLKRITLGPRYMKVNQTEPNYLNITPAYTSCPAAKPAANPCTTIERTNRIIEGVLGAVLGLGILVAAFQVKKFYTHHHIQIQTQTQPQTQTQT